MTSAALYQRTGEGQRLWVRLSLSKADVDRPGSLLHLPGDYLLTGMWYGDDPLNPDSYGKAIPIACGGRRVGRVSRRSSRATLRRLGHEGRKIRPVKEVL